MRHMMNHLEDHGLLIDGQHGFRGKRSCETQLVNFTQELMKGLSEGQQYNINVIDFFEGIQLYASSAFASQSRVPQY